MYPSESSNGSCVWDSLEGLKLRSLFVCLHVIRRMSHNCFLAPPPLYAILSQEFLLNVCREFRPSNLSCSINNCSSGLMLFLTGLKDPPPPPILGTNGLNYGIVYSAITSVYGRGGSPPVYTGEVCRTRRSVGILCSRDPTVAPGTRRREHVRPAAGKVFSPAFVRAGKVCGVLPHWVIGFRPRRLSAGNFLNRMSLLRHDEPIRRRFWPSSTSSLRLRWFGTHESQENPSPVSRRSVMIQY